MICVWNFFSSPPKYCFLTSATRVSIVFSSIFTPRSAALTSNSARCTRNCTACCWSATYSLEPAVGNVRFCDVYERCA